MLLEKVNLVHELYNLFHRLQMLKVEEYQNVIWEN